jgi:hypothetical protein
MSVTVCWRPIKGTKSFGGGRTDSLNALLESCGSELAERHVPILRAMAVAARDPFFSEVADKIEQIGEIEVWGEY